jgi:hypothetical protein
MYSSAFKKPTTDPSKIEQANQLIDQFVSGIDWVKLSLMQDEFYRDVEKRKEVIENLQYYLADIVTKEVNDLGVRNLEDKKDQVNNIIALHIDRLVKHLVAQNILEGIPAHSTDQDRYDNLFYKSLSPKDIYNLNNILKLLGANLRNDKGDLSSDWMRELFSIIVELKLRDKPVNVANIQEESGYKFVLAE